jgi:hypothetical protein
MKPERNRRAGPAALLALLGVLIAPALALVAHPGHAARFAGPDPPALQAAAGAGGEAAAPVDACPLCLGAAKVRAAAGGPAALRAGVLPSAAARAPRAHSELPPLRYGASPAAPRAPPPN